MLGFIQSDTRGESDRMIAAVARDLQASGLRVAGFIQINTEVAPDRPCIMDLESVDGATKIRISQDLGVHGIGCRLDPQGLETAVGLAAAAIAAGDVDFLVVNKFGKQEAEGRGFRPLIAAALLADIPVLTAVSQKNSESFMHFAEDTAVALPMVRGAVIDWCQSVAMGSSTRGIGRGHLSSR